MGKANMLVLEEVEINRMILKNVFQDTYEILEADTGKRAWQILTSDAEVDLIIVEMNNPVIDGESFLFRLRHDSRFCKIPVIASSQFAGSKDEAHALELGADDFVAKPYQQKVLKKRIESVMEQHNQEQKKIMKLLHLDEEGGQSFIEQMPFGYALIEYDKKVSCLYMNQTLFHIFGISQNEIKKVEQFNLFGFMEKDDYKEIEQRIVAGDSDIAKLCKMKDYGNQTKWIEYRIQKLSDDSIYYQVYFVDKTNEISEKLSLEGIVEVLKMNSKCDSLTGIYHRESFYKKTKEMISDAPEKEYCMMVWNIDRFKMVNEQFGTRIGDELLIRFSVILRETFQKIGTFCRLESDRFASCTTEDNMQYVYEKLSAYVENGIQGNLINYPVMMHVGIYYLENTSMSVDLMVDRANLGLQSVKQSVVNRWGYYKADMRSLLFDEQELEQDMQIALDEEQFFILLQPIVEANTERIISAEALVRWEHPTKGMISPNIFIPVFEKNGFIGKLDIYVWRKVCEMLYENKVQGRINVPISVNLSRVNFYKENICEQYFEIADEYQIEPALLKIEITESAYTEDAEQMIAVVRKFHDKGFTVLMDDFGSGYSSLNMLKDVPVDVLKVDMKFMYNLETSEKGANILYSVINMAHSMNMSTVAEGVETQNQYEMLCELACDSIQGYYFSKPLVISEFNKKLQQEYTKITTNKVVEGNTVLVVDDVQLMREIIKNALGEEYQYLEAKNGLEAIQILRKNFLKIKLIITDVCMPQMDGLGFLNEIHENPNLSRIPVLVVTTYDETANIIKALELGAMDVISKPFEPTILRKRIQNILQFRGHEMIRKELSILKDRNDRSKMQEDFLASDAISMICFDVDIMNKCSTIRFVNEHFKELHHLNTANIEHNRSILPLFQNVVERDQEIVNRYYHKILDEHAKELQCIYSVYTMNGDEQKLFCNLSMQYEENRIAIQMVEMKVYAHSPYFHRDSSFYEMLKQVAEGSELSIYRYDIMTNMMQFKRKSCTGEWLEINVPWTREQITGSEYALEDAERLITMTKRLTLGERKVTEVFYCPNRFVAGKLVQKPWWNRLSFTNIYDEEGNAAYAVGTSEDITQVIEENNGAKMNTRYRDIMKRDTYLFAELDLTENKFISMECVDYEKDDFAGFEAFVEEIVKNRIYEDEKKYTKGMLQRKQLLKWYQEGETEVNFEFRYLEKEENNQYAWFSTKLYFFKRENQNHIGAILQFKNVHTEKVRINRILKLAEHDSLTGLLNRNAFENAVEQTLEENAASRRYSAFIMIDVDNFKTVNDTYGHEFGDEVLKTVANQIQGTFRKEDYVGRMGGDEFAVYLPRIASEDIVENKVKALNKKMQRAFENCGKEINVSCSVGISMAPENGTSFRSLYESADFAQYIAKKNGKNQYRNYNRLTEQEKEV